MLQDSTSQVFLILSDKCSDWVKDFYHLVGQASSMFGKTVLLYHNKNNEIPAVVRQIEYHAFDNSILNNLQYQPIQDKLLPGSNHFPVLEYYLQHPAYAYYWYIEDDMRLNGNWSDFFRFFSEMPRQADFISCHIRHFNEEPLWHWWNTLKQEGKRVPAQRCLRSFNPIFRISNAALGCIHEALTAGWQGHHEVLIPTLLQLKGFDVMDFGGTGKFVQPGMENKFYIDSSPDAYGNISSGSMRYRPVITNTSDLQNKLYHPVKVDVSVA